VTLVDPTDARNTSASCRFRAGTSHQPPVIIRASMPFRVFVIPDRPVCILSFNDRPPRSDFPVVEVLKRTSVGFLEQGQHLGCPLTLRLRWFGRWRRRVVWRRAPLAYPEEMQAGLRDKTGTSWVAPHGPWPDLAAGASAPPPDADHDGMTDDWEKSHGLDPADPKEAPRRRRTATPMSRTTSTNSQATLRRDRHAGPASEIWGAPRTRAPARACVPSR
jgi:hypothetical protein